MNAQRVSLSFDQAVWFVVAAIVAALALVILRGDQLQLLPRQMVPASDAVDVSTRTQIVLQFDQPLAPLPPGATLQLSPAITGTLQLADDRLLFLPTSPLTAHMTYTVSLNTPLRGRQGGTLRQPLTWHFTTGGLQVAYSTTDNEGREQLFVTDAQIGQAQSTPAVPRQLTTDATTLWDFTVAPRSDHVVYSTLKEDGTSDLWSIHVGDAEPTRLVPCPNAFCNSSAWSPDGTLLAYVRRNGSEFAAAAFSPPRLWLFDPISSETLPVFNDSQKLAYDPSWSADGAWLSYIAPNDGSAESGGIGVVALATGEEHFYPTESGETGSWHPQEIRLLYTAFQRLDEQYVGHIIMVKPATGVAVNLSGERSLTEDGSPSWSPDGAWIAFRRKELTGDGATRGKQLWRMRSDGTDAEALTSDPASDYSAPQWSPDGRYLLFHQLPLRGPEIVLTVWIYDLETGERWQVANPGQRPQWVP